MYEVIYQGSYCYLTIAFFYDIKIEFRDGYVACLAGVLT